MKEEKGLFASLATWREGCRWHVTACRQLTLEEKKSIIRTEVIPSNFGQSVKFVLKDTDSDYVIPVACGITFTIGKSVDINSIWIITLTKGNENVYRVSDRECEDK